MMKETVSRKTKITIIYLPLIILIITGCKVSLFKSKTIRNLNTGVTSVYHYDKNQLLLSQVNTKKTDTLYIGYYKYNDDKKLVQELHFLQSALNSPYLVRNYSYKDSLIYEVFTDDTVLLNKNVQTLWISDSCQEISSVDNKTINCYSNEKIVSSEFYKNKKLQEYSYYKYNKNIIEQFRYSKDSVLIYTEHIETNKKEKPMVINSTDYVTNEKLTLVFSYEYW